LAKLGCAVLAALLDGLKKGPAADGPVDDGGRAHNADAGMAKWISRPSKSLPVIIP
jgi:hypothetical protein